MKIIITAIFVLISFCCSAQHSFEDQIMSENWELIGSTKFKALKSKLVPEYSVHLKQYHHKSFELEGYMVPIKAGKTQISFMLSTLPINQCFYCGKNGVPIMVFVKMKKEEAFTFKPVKILGTLNLADTDAMENPPVSLLDAIFSADK